MRFLLNKIWGKESPSDILSREVQERFAREERAAMRYIYSLEKENDLDLYEICDRYHVTRQCLLNGWARIRFDVPPFMQPTDFIGY